jgi:hypothetical protein
LRYVDPLGQEGEETQDLDELLAAALERLRWLIDCYAGFAWLREVLAAYENGSLAIGWVEGLSDYVGEGVVAAAFGSTAIGLDYEPLLGLDSNDALAFLVDNIVHESFHIYMRIHMGDDFAGSVDEEYLAYDYGYTAYNYYGGSGMVYENDPIYQGWKESSTSLYIAIASVYYGASDQARAMTNNTCAYCQKRLASRMNWPGYSPLTASTPPANWPAAVPWTVGAANSYYWGGTEGN